MNKFDIPNEILICKWSKIEPSTGKEMIPQAHCDHPESIKEIKEGGFVEVLCLGPNRVLGMNIVCHLFEVFK